MNKATKRKISTRLIRKGALIEETYSAFQLWDLSKNFADNLSILRESNIWGAHNQSWLREITATLSTRFSNQHHLSPLIQLAKAGFELSRWKPCLLWHLAAIDELYYRFALEWLYPAFQDGTYLIRTEDVVPFVTELTSGQIASGGELSAYGTLRAARDLLRMSADFDQLTGAATRQFNNYHLSQESFLFILYSLSDREENPRNIIDAPEWRLFLMSPSQVEHELMELHQYQQVNFEMAGSLVHLNLPCKSLHEYVERLINNE
ncbi:BrxA family protein [Geomonas propionica]|uniref:DUF1819 family protein n=1 Tax=Geomonas propionica TaxID=2798582 RepID=A0ABS0YP42_9BACT|nr:BrxA family protein [Geomonas propionica]MBJ6799743.1 DUF1819 family protein [Geomonas propionica]